MDLKLIGLSQYEAKGYAALVRLGKSTASQISRASGVSYGKIYEVLAVLESKGLIKSIPEKTKHFVATDPTALFGLIEKKQKDLNDLKKSVSDLKQIYEEHDEEPIRLAAGKGNFYKLSRELMSPEKFKYTIRYTGEFQPEWARKDQKLLKHGVDLKMLVRFDNETRERVRKWRSVYNKNMRTFENSGVAVDIRDKEVLITILRRNVSVHFKDEAFAQVMKSLFLGSYNAAEQCEFSKQ